MGLIYDPWNFTELYETPLGQALWNFLCLPANIVRAETAVDLRRTCVEALERPLNERFHDEFQKMIEEDALKGENKFLRIKQMIGHMVGQIMLSRGYLKDKEGVILPRRKESRSNVLFLRRRFVSRGNRNPCFSLLGETIYGVTGMILKSGRLSKPLQNSN